MDARFKNRYVAGQLLAQALPEYAHHPDDMLVLALPRGGVPVGYAVARALGAELDVLVVRKLGVPHEPELAMGAIGSGGAKYINDQVVALAGVSPRELEAVVDEERSELAQRERTYRGLRPPAPIEGRTVILVDDGIATGASMRVAIQALRTRKPGRIVVAVPVAPYGAQQKFADVTDAFVSLLSPRDFGAVGQFYENFEPTHDMEVRTLLEDASKEVVR